MFWGLCVKLKADCYFCRAIIIPSLSNKCVDAKLLFPNSAYCVDRKEARYDFKIDRSLGMPLKSKPSDQQHGLKIAYRSGKRAGGALGERLATQVIMMPDAEKAEQ